MIEKSIRIVKEHLESPQVLFSYLHELAKEDITPIFEPSAFYYTTVEPVDKVFMYRTTSAYSINNSQINSQEYMFKHYVHERFLPFPLFLFIGPILYIIKIKRDGVVGVEIL